MPSNGYSVNRETEEQSAGTAVASPEISVPSGCVTSVNPGSVSFEDVGGTIFIEVLRQDANCTFTISEQAWWLSIQNETFRGFDIVCSPNEMAASRSATVNVDGINVTVTQKGVVINSYNVTGGGTLCSDGSPGSGVDVGLAGSDIGVSYALRRNVTTTVMTLSGTGSALDFGKQTVTGSYTVVASKNGLNQQMPGSASVVVNPLPSSFTYGGGGVLTPCITSASIDLIWSETDVTYTLYCDGNPVSSKDGDGGLMTWDGLTTPGNYEIIGVSTNGCQASMSVSGSASISQQTALDPGIISGSKWVCYNSPAGELKNETLATGGDPSKYEYIWEVSTDEINWTGINNTDVASYSPTESLTSTHYYRRTISDGCEIKHTQSVTILVHEQLIPGSISGTKNICYGSSAGILDNENLATGGAGELSYQWEVSTDNSTWIPIANTNVASYQPPGTLTSTHYYRRTVSDICDTKATASVKVTVGAELIPGSIIGTKTICYNSSAGSLDNVNVATGGSGTLSYQWEVSTDGSNWTRIGSTNVASYSPGTLTSTRYYRRTVSDDCTTKATASVKVTVGAELIPGSIIGTKTICYNSSAGSLDNVNVATGGSGALSYQWEVSTNGSTWTGIGSTNVASYSPGTLTSTRYYRRTVSDDCTTKATASVKVTVGAELNPGSIIGTKTICYNSSAGSLDNVNVATGGSGALSYQWEVSTDGSNWTGIGSTDVASYSPGTLTSTRYYRRTVSDDCVTKYSNVVTVSVNSELNPGIISGTQTICYDSSVGTLSSANLATGGSGTLSYHWEESTDGSNWTGLDNSNVASYQPPGTLTSTHYYRRTVSDDCTTKATASVTITVRAQLDPGSINGTQNISYNTQPDPLTGSTATGGTGSYEYTWYESTDNSTWTPINNSNAVSYSPGVLTQSTWYYRKVTDLGGCGSVNSSSVKVSVYNAPTMPPSAEASYSSGQTVLSKPSALTSYEEYYWQTGSTGTSMADGNATKLYTTDNTYYLRSYHTVLGTWGPTRVGEVMVYTQPGIPPTPEITMEDGKTTVSLDSIGIPEGETYYWEDSAEGETTDNSSMVREFSASKTVYLRSRLGAPSYLWSDALTVEVDVIPSETAYSNKNYVSQMTIRQEGITDTASVASLTAAQKSETVNYFDGLGRLAQEVQVKASPGLADIVRPVRYDAYGREAMKFLSYPKANSNGAFVATDSTEQAAYYTELHGSADGTTAFAETVFDNSPLNRVMEQGAPGQAWQLAGGHTVKMGYLPNQADEVALYRVDPVTDSLAVGSPSWYDAGTLYKTVTKDENWTDQGSVALNKLHTTEEFKDKLGQVVLKRSYVLASGSTTQVDELNTYYVYDDFGLLRYVFPPKVFADGNNSINTSEMDSLCYTYKYDGRKRMIEKKLPGADIVYMVYDKRDRLIEIQDGNMRHLGQWQFTKYDKLNRPVLIGIKTTVKTREDQQAYLDSYEGIYYESRDTSDIGYTLDQSFPVKFSVMEKKLQKVIYYDDYDYPGSKAFDDGANVSGYSDTSGDSRYFDNVKGQVTGVREKVLDDNELTTDGIWLVTTTYYDDRYRVIETLRDLYPQSSGNYEVTSSEYDFTGDVLQSKTVQSFEGNNNTVLETYSYDHRGRMTQVKYKLNDNPEIILSSMEYNELGQLERKTLNGAPGAGVQELNYAYNIRGWLSQINDPGVDPGSGSQHQFNMALYYNTVPSGLTADQQYNGNISATEWNTQYNDGSLSPLGKQGYGFTYDALNRLRTANYGEGSNFATNVGVNNVSIPEYDWNGNIVKLNRHMKRSGTVDSLSFSYIGNQLKAVSEAGDRHIGFTEGRTPHDVEYTYDLNGNQTDDDNLGLTAIRYNYLNLTRRLFVGKHKIRYLYTSGGVKLCKQNIIDGDTTSYYYTGNFMYQGSSLKYILNEEGMVTTPSNPVYLYNLKDHLGNTRIQVDDAGTVVQQVDYYPFGMALKISGSSDNKYLYNGKELQDDAIGLGNMDWYDYGARFYDPALGRWHSVDPLAESCYNNSSYSYTMNNPIRFIDPDGMRTDEYIFNEKGDYTGKIKKPGEHTGLVLGSSTRKPLSFKFADPENDPKAIDKGEIAGVEIVSDKTISEVLDESGVNDKENQANKVEFITSESDASNLKGEGKMDYVVTAKPSIDGVKQPIRADKLYITKTASGAVAHNNYNFGNFLWGAGASKLGFSKFAAKLGAHINSLMDPHYRSLDSKDDQYSIGLGYEWSKSNK
ncbi:hypothetical protein PbJCM13498_30980 [Prolixibacter bellariivorans]|uniref:DUF6443 domain-containing protein n=4 Tax=Prolixibacter bellariivorans TaxID=314319 RepID=A0A5M4B244_9BACT|nr:hypothetical protein PbJCM13498_30980 [Prolixibacter bellariivorans]